MKDKIKFDLSDTEISIITKSLNAFRNYLSVQERPVDFINDIIVKVNSKKIELDSVDSKIVINALNVMRNKLKEENQPREEINNILLKIIDKTDKKNFGFKEIWER